MVITAHGFAMPVKEAFAPVLKLRKWLNPVSLIPGWQNAAAAVLFRRGFTRSLKMSVFYPLIQALVLFAVAPLLSGITRVVRARLHNRRGPGSTATLSNCSVVRVLRPLILAGFFA